MPQVTISAILNFAGNVDINSSTLTSDLRSFIPVFPVDNLPSKQRTAFDMRGTEVWNLATRRYREATSSDNVSDDEKTKHILLRVFAFGMLDAAACSRNNKVKRVETCVRMLKVAFKTMKACIDGDELDLAGKIAQRAAFWLDEGAEVVPEDLQTNMNGEYYVWRMALAWKQDKLEVAEHMYTKFWKEIRAGPQCVEDLADVLYELGKSLSIKKHYDLAATWLERALDAIENQDIDRLSDDAGDLKLAIMQQLVKSLLMLKTEAARDKARNVVDIIERGYSNKLIATLLKLELLSTEEAPNPADYFDVVNKMIYTIMLTRANFKTIMHHIHKLKKLSTILASKSLDELIKQRLLIDAKEEWVERACMMRIWIATAVESNVPDSSALKTLLDNMRNSGAKSFTAAAAHAAQTLLWSHIERAYEDKQYDVAEAFCDIALHELFEKCGELNRAKVARKRILCAIEKADHALARNVYFDMPESSRDAPETRYLMYKVAIRDNDPTVAAECLAILTKHASKDPTRLYACVLDAVQVGDDHQAYQALNKLLEIYETMPTKGINLPALLRCMIRLIKTGLNTAVNKSEQREEAIGTLCSLFEAAGAHAKRPSSNGEYFTADELNWFSKNSYNFAIENMEQIHPTMLVRLCLTCSQLIDLLDRDTPPAEKINLRLRHIFCKYLVLTTLTVLARGEDNIERCFQHYHAVMKHGASLRVIISEQMEDESLSDPVKTDLMNKHIQSVKFELEAALHLRRWSDLSQLFDQCWKYDDPKQWSTLADLSFSIHKELCEQGPEVMHAHQKVVLHFIERIINKSWKPHESVDKLAKHLRCFFHLTLGKEDIMAGHCMDQVTIIVEKCKMGRVRYPQNELEWMVATAFNHAVTCFCMKDDESCQFWAEKALTLAAQADDGGNLGKELRNKYAILRWDDK